jgi:hypothetical protein
MHHPIRAVTMTPITAEKIRVSGFEILKQNNSSAIENITILFTSALTNFDILTNDLRPHQQCPRETEDNSHRFQTKNSVIILEEVSRLPKCD